MSISKPAFIKDESNASVAPVTAASILKVRALVERLRALEREVIRLDAELEEKRAAARDLSTRTIPILLMDEIGLESITLDDGTSITVATEYYPNVLEANRPKFFAWLKQNNYDAIIKNEIKVALGKGEEAKAMALLTRLREERYNVSQKQTVHPQTLRAFVRELEEQNASLPSFIDPGQVRVTKIKEA